MMENIPETIKESLLSKEVVIHLLDQLKNAVGWVFRHFSTEESAKKIAIENYIENIQSSELSPLDKAALTSNAKKIIKEYSNQVNIVERAIYLLEPDSVKYKIDESWISIFLDVARFSSDVEFQEILARVLAKEANQPGSIPKQLVSILNLVDRNDARVFGKLCARSIDVCGEVLPVIINDGNIGFKGIDISQDDLINLQALGLINYNVANHNCADPHELPILVQYGERQIRYYGPNNSVFVGSVVFTKNGSALCKALNCEKNMSYLDEVIIPLWKNNGDKFEVEKN